jgi:F-type H+-transporting ATPase subunit b
MESLRAFCAKVGTAVSRAAGILLLCAAFLLCQDQGCTASESGHSGSGKTHRDGGHGESALAVVWKWGNFLILFGGLGWYLRKPLKDFLESRTRSIQEGLANGRLAKEMAAKQLSEIESRLAHVDEEIRALKTQAFSEAEEERSRILESAKVEARKILELAQREIDGIKKSARLELKSHIAELAVRLAEEQLQKSVGSEENRRLVLQFLDSLEVAKN